jgi:hypothetical protein
VLGAGVQQYPLVDLDHHPDLHGKRQKALRLNQP